VAFWNPHTGQIRRQTNNGQNAAVNIWLEAAQPVRSSGCVAPVDISGFIEGRTRLGDDACGDVAATSTRGFDPAARDACEARYIDPCCADVADATRYARGDCSGGCRACSYVQSKVTGSWMCIEGPDVVFGCATLEYSLQLDHLQYLLAADRPAVGDPITVMPRGYPHSFMVMGSERMVIDGVAVHGGTNMGILESGGQGNNTYRDVSVSRRPQSGHLLSVNADGFHSTNVAVGPSLARAEVRYTGDDLLNITPRIMLVLAIAGHDLLLLDPGSHSELLGRGSVVSFFQPPSPGALKPSLKTTGRLTEVPRRASIAEAQAALATTRQRCARVTRHNTDAFFVAQNVWAYRLAHPIGTRADVCDLAQDLSKANVHPSVVDSVFDASYARAAMLKCSGETIRNSSFGNAGGLWAGIEPAWLEGALNFGKEPAVLDGLELTALGAPWLSPLPGSSCADVALRGGTPPLDGCRASEHGAESPARPAPL